jgi:hypothetical protein
MTEQVPSRYQNLPGTNYDFGSEGIQHIQQSEVGAEYFPQFGYRTEGTMAFGYEMGNFLRSES